MALWLFVFTIFLNGHPQHKLIYQIDGQVFGGGTSGYAACETAHRTWAHHLKERRAALADKSGAEAWLSECSQVFVQEVR